MSAEHAAVLDATGLRCPLPVVRAEAALRAMRGGERLLILADDPVATVDIPHFCRGAGHQVERLPDRAAQGGGPVCVFMVTRAEKP